MPSIAQAVWEDSACRKKRRWDDGGDGNGTEQQQHMLRVSRFVFLSLGEHID